MHILRLYKSLLFCIYKYFWWDELINLSSACKTLHNLRNDKEITYNLDLDHECDQKFIEISCTNSSRRITILNIFFPSAFPLLGGVGVDRINWSQVEGVHNPPLEVMKRVAKYPLKDLDVESDVLMDSGPIRCEQIKYFIIENTKDITMDIEKLPKLSDMPNLEDFRLHCNELCFDVKDFSTLKHLIHFCLYIPFSKKNLDITIQVLENLNNVDMDSITIEFTDVKSNIGFDKLYHQIAKFKKLSHLALYLCRHSSIPIEMFTDSISELYITGEYTDVSLMHFKNLKILNTTKIVDTGNFGTILSQLSELSTRRIITTKDYIWDMSKSLECLKMRDSLSSILKVMSYCPRLKKIDLNFVDVKECTVAKECSKLIFPEMHDISIDLYEEDDSLKLFFDQLDFPNVKHLSLDGLGCTSLLNGKFNKVETLMLDGFQIDLELFSTLPQLKDCTLCFEEEIGYVLKSLCKNCPKLKSLDIQLNREINSIEIIDLITSCKDLKSIDISDEISDPRILEMWLKDHENLGVLCKFNKVDV